MNKIVKVERTTLRVNNSGETHRKYDLSADAQLDAEGNVAEVNNGSIYLPEGTHIGNFSAPSGDGFSINLNSGASVNREEAFAEINSFITAIEEKGGEK